MSRDASIASRSFDGPVEIANGVIEPKPVKHLISAFWSSLDISSFLAEISS